MADKKSTWFSVMWKNWRTPDDDQLLSCEQLPGPITFETYKILRYEHGVFTIVDAHSNEQACDRAGKIFDRFRHTLTEGKQLDKERA